MKTGLKILFPYFFVTALSGVCCSCQHSPGLASSKEAETNDCSRNVTIQGAYKAPEFTAIHLQGEFPIQKGDSLILQDGELSRTTQLFEKRDDVLIAEFGELKKLVGASQQQSSITMTLQRGAETICSYELTNPEKLAFPQDLVSGLEVRSRSGLLFKQVGPLSEGFLATLPIDLNDAKSDTIEVRDANGEFEVLNPASYLTTYINGIQTTSAPDAVDRRWVSSLFASVAIQRPESAVIGGVLKTQIGISWRTPEITIDYDHGKDPYSGILHFDGSMRAGFHNHRVYFVMFENGAHTNLPVNFRISISNQETGQGYRLRVYGIMPKTGDSHWEFFDQGEPILQAASTLGSTELAVYDKDTTFAYRAEVLLNDQVVATQEFWLMPWLPEQYRGSLDQLHFGNDSTEEGL
jgi:hypothetical protein